MKKSVIKNISILILSIILLLYSFYAFFELNGNPFTYFKAKNAVTKYINTNYQDKLILGKMSYNFKNNGYVFEVMEKEDSRNSAYIEYYSNKNIYDDYSFRVQEQMENQVNNMLQTLLETSDIDLKIVPDVSAKTSLPNFKYNLSSRFRAGLPLTVELSFDNLFTNEDEFNNNAYKAITVLYQSGLKFDEVLIKSFLPTDGNKAYECKITSKITNLDQIKQLTSIISYEK